MLNVRFFYFISLLFTISYQSKIFEILSTTDQFFNEFYAQNNLVDSDSLSVLIKRTFDWNDKHQIFKRSLNKEEDLEKEKLGEFYYFGVLKFVVSLYLIFIKINK